MFDNEFYFLNGRMMKYPHGVLDAKYQVQIYGIKYCTFKKIDKIVLQGLIEEAMVIDKKFWLLKKSQNNRIKFDFLKG